MIILKHGILYFNKDYILDLNKNKIISSIEYLKQENIKAPLTYETLKLYLSLDLECLVKFNDGFIYKLQYGAATGIDSYLKKHLKLLTISDIKNIDVEHISTCELYINNLDIIQESWSYKFRQKIVKPMKRLRNTFKNTVFTLLKKMIR